MKYYGNLVLISTLFFAFFACGDSEEVVVDFREDFTGIYNCQKVNFSGQVDPNAPEVEIIVDLDPENENNLLVATYSLPVDEDGSYGPDYIKANTLIELSFNGDSIYFKEQPEIPNGIILPCIFKGVKQE